MKQLFLYYETYVTFSSTLLYWQCIAAFFLQHTMNQTLRQSSMGKSSINVLFIAEELESSMCFLRPKLLLVVLAFLDTSILLCI